MTVLFVSPATAEIQLPAVPETEIQQASGVISAVGQMGMRDFDLVVVDGAACHKAHQPVPLLVAELQKHGQPYVMLPTAPTARGLGATMAQTLLKVIERETYVRPHNRRAVAR